jgi:uncharacterized membrane protein YbhN (UPF0104 family)
VRLVEACIRSLVERTSNSDLGVSSPKRVKTLRWDWTVLFIRAPSARVMACAFIVQGLGICALAAAIKAVNLQPVLSDTVIAAMAVSIAVALPISIAGIGIREAGVPLLLVGSGSMEQITSVGIIWSAVVLIIGLFSGASTLVRVASSDLCSEIIDRSSQG